MKVENISVIIPAYNNWLSLRSCIKSLNNQTLKPKEIIVIDNSDDTIVFSNLKKFFPRVKVYKTQKNIGISAGRNLGALKANKKNYYLLFVDHDMTAKSDLINNLWQVFKNYPQVGVVTPKIYYKDFKKRIWSAGTSINLWTGQVLFRGGEDRGQFNKIEEVDVAPALFMVKRDVFEKIGGFSEEYFAVFEDTDFCFKVKKSGFKVFYAPLAVAYHQISINRQDEIDRLLNRSYFIARNRILFMKNYAKSYSVFLLFLPVFITYYLFFAVRNLKFKSALNYIKGTIEGLS